MKEILLDMIKIEDSIDEVSTINTEYVVKMISVAESKGVSPRKLIEFGVNCLKEFTESVK